MNLRAIWAMATEQTIVGIDPGTRQIGYAVLAVTATRWQVIDCGVVRTPNGLPVAARLAQLFDEVTALLQEHAADCLVVEEPHVRPWGVKSALAVAQSVGVVKAAAAKAGVTVVSYPYTQVKRALTGSGATARSVLAVAVQHLLQLAELPPWQDAVDALAFALCHCLLVPQRQEVPLPQ